MASVSWWAPQIKSELSQGDILSPVLIGSSAVPETYLVKRQFRGGEQAWSPSSNWQPDGNGKGSFLGKGRIIHGIVVSHDCELDKKRRSARVLVAPISSLEKLLPEESQPIIEQTSYSKMPLPDIPQLGNYYVDLNCLMWLDREIVDRIKRIASMSEDGVTRLHAQLFGFFTRKQL